MKRTEVRTTLEGGIGICTLTPAEGQMVTLSTPTMLELEATLKKHSACKAFVLTGSGKAFAAGAHIPEMLDIDPAQATELGKMGQRVIRMLETMPQPVIGAINGFALGGGCELALGCDLRIASRTAKFSQPEAGLGIPPGWAATMRLERLVGLSRAKEMVLTGRSIKAEEALAIGLVHSVVEPDRLMDSALREARRLLERGPNAMALIKQMFAGGDDLELFAKAFTHPDRKEGIEAFVAKRKARFS